jgi:hypothetical protein
MLSHYLYCDALEVKSSATFDPSFLSGLAHFAALQGHPGGEIVFGGDTSFSVGDYRVASWRDI